MGKKTKTD